MNDSPINKAIILFDGVCNLCNSSVNLVIRRDKKNYFQFAPLQSDVAKQLLKNQNTPLSKTESMVLLENGKIFFKSSAALRTARHLGGLYPLFYGLIIIPTFIRNAVYDLISRNRYKWFGKRETCMLPTEELKKKFIS